MVTGRGRGGREEGGSPARVAMGGHGATGSNSELKLRAHHQDLAMATCRGRRERQRQAQGRGARGGGGQEAQGRAQGEKVKEGGAAGAAASSWCRCWLGRPRQAWSADCQGFWAGRLGREQFLRTECDGCDGRAHFLESPRAFDWDGFKLFLLLQCTALQCYLTLPQLAREKDECNCTRSRAWPAFKSTPRQLAGPAQEPGSAPFRSISDSTQ